MKADELDSATDEQLNAMAAKNVMGWKPCVRPERGFGTKPPPPFYFVNENGDVERQLDTEVRFHLWSPATSIADAWELPPKLEPEWLVTVTRRTGDVGEWANKLRYHVDFRRIGESEPRYVCYAHEDQARAITTAALLAWGEKEKA